MLNENLSSSWKSKLAELDGLPGEEKPSGELAWEKLYKRLGGRINRTKKFVWYRAIAATALITLVISFFFINMDERQIANIKLETKEQSSPGTNRVETPAKHFQGAKLAPLLENKRRVQDSKKLKTTSSVVHQAHTDDEIRLPETVSDDILPGETAGMPPAMDSLSLHTTTVAVKKKLKVVHINELGDPVEMPAELANKRALHAIRLTLATQEISVNPSVAIRKDGFTIFKTKLSPSN